MTRWLASSEHLRPASLRSYDGHIRLYLIPHLGRIQLARLTPTRLQEMFNAIQRQHAAAGRPVSAGTLTRIWATLRVALNAGYGRG